MRSRSTVRRPRAAYPVLLLLLPALAAGCAAGDRPTATPGNIWHGPTAPGTAEQPTRPTPAGPTPAPESTTPAPSPTRTPARHVFPVRAKKVAYHPTHSAYPGTDIFADCGEPVVAVTDGVILEVSRVDRFDKRGPLGPFNGGLSVSLLGDDGVRYYGSHLSAVATGIDPGVRVRAGQPLGQVGHTGNANIRRGVIWPAPYLGSWRKRGNREPAAEVAAWQRAHGCPKAPAKAGGAG